MSEFSLLISKLPQMKHFKKTNVMVWIYWLLVCIGCFIAGLGSVLLLLTVCCGKRYTSTIIRNVARDLRNKGIHEYFLYTVNRYPEKEAIYDISLDKSYSFRELNEMSNRYAHMLQKYQIRNGDVVGIILGNGVHHVAAWIGCAKIGAVSAWINTNLTGTGLVHSIRAADATTIVANSKAFKELNNLFDEGLLKKDDYKLFVLGAEVDTGNTCRIEEECSVMSTEEPLSERRIEFNDPLCYIFTSGTTGLPKAAVIKHFRYYYIATGAQVCCGVKHSDRIYLCLPLYHTSAGALGLGQMILHGTTVVVREKFSASNFFKDTVKYQCTVSIYIGEVLRYVLQTPSTATDKQHSIRLLIGNGLRPASNEEIPYGPMTHPNQMILGNEQPRTEVNIDGREGACGFMTVVPFIGKIYPLRLFKVTADGELIRDAQGYCIPIRPGESGTVACLIRKGCPLYHFEGYAEKEDTEKKIIYEALPGAPPMFLSGDILHWDRAGYFYFEDRLGDTFRWKGENVSTTQVESVLLAVDDLAEAVVYGVEIPGCEGRAGMATIVLKNSESEERTEEQRDVLLSALSHSLTVSLPPYAIPLFIRISSTIETTGTFKMKKVTLKKLGYDITSDSTVYLLDSTAKEYRPLTFGVKALIDNGECKL